jgi:hypothetical protein
MQMLQSVDMISAWACYAAVCAGVAGKEGPSYAPTSLLSGPPVFSLLALLTSQTVAMYGGSSFGLPAGLLTNTTRMLDVSPTNELKSALLSSLGVLALAQPATLLRGVSWRGVVTLLLRLARGMLSHFEDADAAGRAQVVEQFTAPVSLAWTAAARMLAAAGPEEARQLGGGVSMFELAARLSKAGMLRDVRLAQGTAHSGSALAQLLLAPRGGDGLSNSQLQALIYSCGCMRMRAGQLHNSTSSACVVARAGLEVGLEEGAVPLLEQLVRAAGRDVTSAAGEVLDAFIEDLRVRRSKLPSSSAHGARHTALCAALPGYAQQPRRSPRRPQAFWAQLHARRGTGSAQPTRVVQVPLLVLAILARAPENQATSLAASLAKGATPWEGAARMPYFVLHLMGAAQWRDLPEVVAVAAEGAGAAQLRQLLAGMLAYWARCCREGVGCIKQSSSFFGCCTCLRLSVLTTSGPVVSARWADVARATLQGVQDGALARRPREGVRSCEPGPSPFDTLLPYPAVELALARRPREGVRIGGRPLGGGIERGRGDGGSRRRGRGDRGRGSWYGRARGAGLSSSCSAYGVESPPVCEAGCHSVARSCTVLSRFRRHTCLCGTAGC